MRKHLLSAMLCVVTIVAMAIPASAASSSDLDDLEFTNEELMEMGSPLNLGDRKWSSTVTAYFSDPESKYALSAADGVAGYYYYWDRQGNAHNVKDIIGEGYYQFAPFFEGLAAVIKYNKDAPTKPVDMRYTVGYVNEKGEEVIPCQYNVIPNTFSQDYFTSRFKDGYAYVYKSDGKSSAHNVSGSIAKIDKTGQIVGDWVDYGTFLTYDIRNNIENEPVFRQLQLVSGVYSGFRDYSCDYFTIRNQWGLGMDYDRTHYPATADAIVVPTYQWEPFKITAVMIDCAKLGLKTSLKSTIDLKIFDQGPKRPLGYTVTNNTGKPVDAYYALLSYWPTTSYYPPTEMYPQEGEYFHGQLLPLDLKLAPGEKMSGDCWATAVGWSTMTHIWIEFDSKEERDSFYSNKALTNFMDSQYEIDNQAEGIQWMKDVMGIVIK